MRFGIYILALIAFQLFVPELVQAQKGIEQSVWEEKVQDIDYNSSDETASDQRDDNQKAGGEDQNKGGLSDFGGSLSFGVDLTIFVIIIGVLVLGLILYLILKNISKPGRGDKEKALLNELNPDNFPDEFASANTLEHAIQLAESEENWKLAIRFRYHLTLQLLSENQWLILKPERTDLDYLNALHNSPYQDGFQGLIRWFNQAWYSKASVSKADYIIIAEAFMNYKKDIQPFKPVSE